MFTKTQAYFLFPKGLSAITVACTVWADFVLFLRQSLYLCCLLTKIEILFLMHLKPSHLLKTTSAFVTSV